MNEEILAQPAYQRIALDIASKIACGHYKEGERISGRSTLASYYGVSPETIRRALYLLSDMHIVQMHHSSGVAILSAADAQRYVEKFRSIHAVQRLQTRLSELIQAQERLTGELKQTADGLAQLGIRSLSMLSLVPYEIRVPAQCPLLGMSIGEAAFWQNTGATIIAIAHEGKVVLSPGPYALFEAGDILYLIGNAASCALSNGYIESGT